MGVHIQMLGTGSAFAKAFNNNNALVTVEGQTLLIDCGITAPKALHEIGKNFGDLAAVLITHIHGDHVGGLEELAFQMKFIYQRKPVLFVADTLVEPLWENTLKGGLQQNESRSLNDYFEVRPLRVGIPAEVLPGLQIELIRTPHIPGKSSYSLLMNGFFFYSADMAFDDSLLESLVNERGVRTIFHDCQLQPPGAVHACLPELLTLPDFIQERVYLMHYGDDQPRFEGHTGLMRFVEQHKIYDFSL
ncbi:beta-lactamase [Cohnella kolymensis]|uniref:Beta-lactamase n=1 Tax=Cohnella kolymensis TaxID=1590652 RepID=A0ABR5A714_9BACL|nr:MBL fold metallo-hydrolase [Cohnella kolymensis]KIL36207.1 beta-lactamase [Cohnella kolymensis]